MRVIMNNLIPLYILDIKYSVDEKLIQKFNAVTIVI